MATLKIWKVRHRIDEEKEKKEKKKVIDVKPEVSNPHVSPKNREVTEMIGRNPRSHRMVVEHLLTLR